MSKRSSTRALRVVPPTIVRRPTRTPAFDELPDYVTVQEWAAYMRIGRNQAYDQVKSGRVPSVRFGRIIRIDKAAARTKQS